MSVICRVLQFPPYATNDTGRPGMLGRRELGHGMFWSCANYFLLIQHFTNYSTFCYCDMTYNVFGGTLNLAQLLHRTLKCIEMLIMSVMRISVSACYEYVCGY